MEITNSKTNNPDETSIETNTPKNTADNSIKALSDSAQTDKPINADYNLPAPITSNAPEHTTQGKEPKPQQVPAAKLRISARAPLLKILAIITIIYSLFIFVIIFILPMLAAVTSSGLANSTAPIIAFLVVLTLLAVGPNLALGTYLLLSKNIKFIKILLTICIVFSGLGVLITIVQVSQLDRSSIQAYITSTTVINIIYATVYGQLVLNIIYFMFLLKVKAQVDLLAIKDKQLPV